MSLHCGLAGVIWRYVSTVLPAVDAELKKWHELADRIPTRELKEQAKASLVHKRFHCEGGAVFAAAPGPFCPAVLRFIVAFQTISDYLDNLCDRAGVQDGAAFRHLHRAMLDAVAPSDQPVTADYYRLYPWQCDGGYLDSLVAACRASVASLPGWRAVQTEVERFVHLYIDLQVYKHIAVAERVSSLTRWFGQECQERDLFWQEFAAACGSTLGVFALCHRAVQPRPASLQPLLQLYFPWVASFHILLDYLIDLAEDDAGGDLNFVSFYDSLDTAEERLIYLYKGALERIDRQQDRDLHRAVLHGLPALYLSDPKVKEQGLAPVARSVLRTGGYPALSLHHLCRLLRKKRPRT